MEVPLSPMHFLSPIFSSQREIWDIKVTKTGHENAHVYKMLNKVRQINK
jgi:hypothetical protein